MLFGNLAFVAGGLTAAGFLILIAGLVERAGQRSRPIGIRDAGWIGAVQGLCLPFRGFSRSGATISTGLLLGNLKARVEEFSFALAVIITPPVIGREVWRLVKHSHEAGNSGVTWGMFAPSLLGMVCAFLAGLVALRWLSRWLERAGGISSASTASWLRSSSSLSISGLLTRSPFRQSGGCAIIRDSPPGQDSPMAGVLQIPWFHGVLLCSRT